MSVNGRHVVDVCGRLACRGDFVRVDDDTVRCFEHGTTFHHVDAAAWVRQ